MYYLPHIYIFILGIMIGSFLNVCIYRIPAKESIVVNRSHCPKCGHGLSWYELIPVFSYIFLRGKCKECKVKISMQYPLIEGLNAILYLLIFIRFGFSIDVIFACLFTSALIVIAMIDARTKEIPFKINVFIFIVAIVNLCFHFGNIKDYLLGFFIISIGLLILFYLSGGGVIGGGDVKLMAVAGLYLGCGKTVLAFFLACLLGSVIHIIRMKFFGASRELALGPYLATALIISLLWGDIMIKAYLSLMF